MTRQKPAFTLLELLTVIAILGMLMSILIPSLSAARRHAKANVCLSNLKGIGTGFVVYLNENEDQFPPFRLFKVLPDMETDYVNVHGRRAPRWQWFIETDMGPVMDPLAYRYAIISQGYFDDETLNRKTLQLGTKMSHEVFTCPALKDEEFAMDIRDGAYGYNYQYLGNTRDDTKPGKRWDNFSVGLHRIRNPAHTVLVADSRGAGREHGRHSFTLDPPRLATERNAMRFGPNPDTWDGTPGSGDVPPGLNSEVYAHSPVEMRHTNQGNVLFVDTHARAMTLKELGYELCDGETPEGVRKGEPIPIHDPTFTPYTATNRLWNGEDVDYVAQEQHAESPGG